MEKIRRFLNQDLSSLSTVAIYLAVIIGYSRINPYRSLGVKATAGQAERGAG